MFEIFFVEIYLWKGRQNVYSLVQFAFKKSVSENFQHHLVPGKLMSILTFHAKPHLQSSLFKKNNIQFKVYPQLQFQKGKIYCNTFLPLDGNAKPKKFLSANDTLKPKGEKYTPFTAWSHKRAALEKHMFCGARCHKSAIKCSVTTLVASGKSRAFWYVIAVGEMLAKQISLVQGRIGEGEEWVE